MSLDARIAARPGDRTRVTGAEAEREVHRLRSGYDAVLVGSGTFRADDPRLTVRAVAPGREPTRRVVLSSQADLPLEAAIFEDVDTAPLHVICGDEAGEAAMERLEGAGAHVHPVAAGEGGLDLEAALSVCWEVGIRSVLCEGGGELAANLLRQRLVHRLYLFVAPRTLGAGGVAAFPDDAEALDWSDFEPAGRPEAFGADTLLVLDRQGA